VTVAAPRGHRCPHGGNPLGRAPDSQSGRLDRRRHITNDRLADVVEVILWRKIPRVQWRAAKLREDLQQDPGNTLKQYRAVFAAGRGVAWVDATTFDARRSIDTKIVVSWAPKNLGHS
jgi:hypothetical protein